MNSTAKFSPNNPLVICMKLSLFSVPHSNTLIYIYIKPFIPKYVVSCLHYLIVLEPKTSMKSVVIHIHLLLMSVSGVD